MSVGAWNDSRNTWKLLCINGVLNDVVVQFRKKKSLFGFFSNEKYALTLLEKKWHVLFTRKIKQKLSQSSRGVKKIKIFLFRIFINYKTKKWLGE